MICSIGKKYSSIHDSNNPGNKNYMLPIGHYRGWSTFGRIGGKFKEIQKQRKLGFAFGENTLCYWQFDKKRQFGQTEKNNNKNGEETEILGRAHASKMDTTGKNAKQKENQWHEGKVDSKNDNVSCLVIFKMCITLVLFICDDVFFSFCHISRCHRSFCLNQEIISLNT